MVLLVILNHFIRVHTFTPFYILSDYALYNNNNALFIFNDAQVHTDFLSSISIYLYIYLCNLKLQSSEIVLAVPQLKITEKYFDLYKIKSLNTYYKCICMFEDLKHYVTYML